MIEHYILVALFILILIIGTSYALIEFVAPVISDLLGMLIDWVDRL